MPKCWLFPFVLNSPNQIKQGNDENILPRTGRGKNGTTNIKNRAKVREEKSGREGEKERV
jgi:hypothetical protein